MVPYQIAVIPIDASVSSAADWTSWDWVSAASSDPRHDVDLHRSDSTALDSVLYYSRVIVPDVQKLFRSACPSESEEIMGKDEICIEVSYLIVICWH